MEKKKKEKKWCHFRHIVTVAFLRFLLRPVLYFKCGFTFKKFQHDKRAYLILYNHQTAYDQFFVGYPFKNKTYYVTSDDLTLIPIISPIIKFLVHIIPYKKASTDFSILRNCRQVASEGGNIAIAPEGNRTFSGKTGYINPTISKMIKFLKLPVAFAIIKGGFGVFPRFSDKTRRGSCAVEVTKVWEYDEYKDLSNDEITDIVKKELYRDESLPDASFKSKRNAEYIERCIYLCPNCGVVHFKSKGETLECPICHSKVRYTDTKQFEKLSGNIEFKTVSEWYDYQREELKKLKLLELDKDKALFSDKTGFFEVIPRKFKKKISKNALIELYPDRLEIKYDGNNRILSFDDINSSGVFGKNKMNFYLNEHTYQFKSDKRFNPLKYVQYYYKYKMEKGENQDEFFGI